ncbi:MAG: V-type ATP synthase subunit F [Ruminococcaceae bacterium]|nr:V-type ATP synthase subunit F [Oscillospiraceae bacterium]
MYKMAIIGDRESALGFLALGFAVFEAESADAAGALLTRLAEGGEYAVILLVEAYAAELGDIISRYKDAPLPAITVIPGKSGGTGLGMKALQSAVIRAVGADILLKD